MREILIYNLVRSNIGYVPDTETLVSRVTLAEDGIFYIECVDWTLREQLNSLFNNPIYIRKSNMDNNYFFFFFLILNPSDGEFLEEIMCRLRIYNLWGKYNVPKKN